MKSRWYTAFGLSLEFTTIVAMALVVTVAIGQAGGVSREIESSLVTMTLIASALGTLALGWSTKLFVAASCRSSFFAASLAAIKMGGLPLLFGMTLFAGLVQAAVSPLLSRLRFIFSAEIGFLVVTLLAFELGAAGLRTYFDAGWHLQTILGIASLVVIYLFSVVGGRLVSRLAFLIAMVAGYIAMWLTGGLGEAAEQHIAHAEWFRLPQLAPGGFAFSWGMIAPFLVPAIVNVIILASSISALQEAKEGEEWKGPDMRKLKKGNIANAIGTILSGLLGGTGVSSTPTTMAMSISSRTFSVRVGWWVAGLTLLLAFIHKATLLFVYIPPLLLATTLIYFGAILAVDGFAYFGRCIEKPGDAIYIFVPLLAGIGYQAYPTLLGDVEKHAHLFSSARLPLSIVFALLLKGLFVLVDNQKRKHKREQ